MPALLIIVALLSTLFSAASSAGLPVLDGLNRKDSFLPVEEAFRPSVRRVQDHWEIHFDIAPGYYLYQQRTFTQPPTSTSEPVSPEQRPANPAKAAQTESAGTLTFIQTPVPKFDKNFGQVKIFHDQLDLHINTPLSQPLTLTYQGCSEQQLCYPPQTLVIRASMAGSDATGSQAAAPQSQHDSLIWVVLSFLGLGIGLSLTPCVFPMVPILASIIAGQSAQPLNAQRGLGLSLSYVIGMASSYAMIGALVAVFGAQVNMAAMTQTTPVILLAVLLFVVLALSMFGLFELQLPGAVRDRFQNWSAQQQGGRFFGSCLMGFFSALVVSPCVSAPLAGALIYLSTTGDVLTGASALFAMGIGMGVPLLLLGVSGGRLLPRSGRWMMLVRQGFGVALLGVALFLLDRILDDSLTMGLAGMLAIGVAVFMNIFDRPTDAPRRLGQAIGLISLVVGVLWITGAARGSNDWLQPLAEPGYRNLAQSDFTEPEYFSSTLDLLHAITATADKRPVVVDIFADWCASCADMDELLRTDNVSRALADYRLLRLDISDSNREQLALLSELKVFGPPALQIYQPDGLPTGQALQGVPEQAWLVSWLQQQGEMPRTASAAFGIRRAD